ncbi:hypothetical protein K450DRAFT_217681 [Umbelopsis ramanniana AG]|uniref:Arrestin C-terminal-like domain-containing protein n=1 Tax=Umbelopsis ramanniana AG TaxID=1314678 RepID=A0AAD5EK82_UMBRA|nr:uncharacterized protein K450DRAFT_217681 [Umbelopsis ramanniana AG]KAI8584720.1 hypothetical protein K450DRAFT_217681 [Umbelopsis ramanniana AG]
MLGRGEFYITLNDSRYFFPGDTINGTVTLSLDKPTKTNCILVIFKGEVEAGGDSFNLFTKQIKVAADVGTLDARTHSFSFEFLVDSHLNLPSSTKLARGSIKYGITAIHERPLIPDALSSKAEYALQILENINAEWPEFAHEAEMCQDVTISGSNDTRKVRIIAKMPRFAFVRGDIIPIELSIKHFEPFTREKGIKVELIRIALFGKSKNQTPVQNALRSLVTDLNVSTSNFVFSATPHILIPTSTPPTIDINGKILNVQYQVRISINLNPSNGTVSKSNNVVLEIPIVVATWPPAAIPIDLDLDEEELEPEPQSSETESDSESGETEQKLNDVPKQVFVAPRPVRTSSLSQSSRPPPIIPFSSQVSGTEIAATALTESKSKDNSNVNRVDGAYPNRTPIGVSPDNVVGINGVDSAMISTIGGDGVKNSTSRTASQRFPVPTVSSVYETSTAPTSFSPNGPPQSMPHESFSRSHSLSHSQHSVVPAIQPSTSQNSGLPLSHSNSINSSTFANSSHYSPNMSMSQPLPSSPGYHSTMPISQMPSPPGLHSAMPAPQSSPSSFDHHPVMPMPHNSPSSYSNSSHYGHTPSISLPQMPIPNFHNDSERHYLPHHSPQKPLLHAYGNQTNTAYQMPEPVNCHQSDYSPENAYYHSQSQQVPSYHSNSYYPQLHSESDPAYAPFTYPMSLPTPGQAMPSAQPMPTPNAPYHQPFTQFPYS